MAMLATLLVACRVAPYVYPVTCLETPFKTPQQQQPLEGWFAWPMLHRSSHIRTCLLVIIYTLYIFPYQVTLSQITTAVFPLLKTQEPYLCITVPPPSQTTKWLTITFFCSHNASRFRPKLRQTTLAVGATRLRRKLPSSTRREMNTAAFVSCHRMLLRRAGRPHRRRMRPLWSHNKSKAVAENAVSPKKPMQ